MLMFPAATLWAHPGHGGSTDPVVHAITSPVHWLPMVAAAALLTVAWWASRWIGNRAGEVTDR